MTTICTKARFPRLLHARSSNAFLFLALFAPTAAASQVIAVRSLPIAESDQLSFFPSLTSGMGGVTIAVMDSLHDPFVNPATGARLRRAFFFSAPTLFSVSNDAGRGRTYPIGALARSGASFGGAAVAIQSINDAPPFGELITGGFFPEQPNRDPGSRSNRYGFLMLGRTLAAARLSIGASALWSDLGIIDGTSLRYFESRRVNQAGRAADVRFGVVKEWNGGQILEALLFNRRSSVTHDVTYGDRYWDPMARQIVLRDRLEQERDRSNAWGMHVEYARPIGDSGWRAGVIVTANRIDNPSRPAYEIENVAGSRSRSAAFNIGLGIARSLGATTLAADAIYEPIWSRIWDVSDSGSTTASIPSGGKTVDSRLRYSNAVLRTGLSHDLTLARDSKLQLQLGVQAHSMYHTMDQRNLVSGSTQSGETSWMEWTRSWGATLRRASVEFHYRGRKMSGAGRPGLSPFLASPPPPGGGVLSADSRIGPPPPAGLRDVSVSTHQLAISLLIR